MEKENREKKISINEEDFATLCVCAIRYCQGRQSYMPSLVQRIVGEHLSDIPNNSLKVMLNDCEFQRQCDLFGDERIDKPGWIRWEKSLKKECEKRETQKK